MSKKVTEHEALKGIDDLLSGLSTEQRQWVFDCIVLKYKIQATTSNQPPQNASPQNQGHIPFNTQTISPVLNSTIKDFLVQKRPFDNYERIACIVYHMEKTQGLEGVKNKDIIKGNKDARQTAFSNPGVFINHAVGRHGYLTTMGGGKKALSAKGEAVVNALPAREAVALVLSEHANKKKSTRKPRKKKKAKA